MYKFQFNTKLKRGIPCLQLKANTGIYGRYLHLHQRQQLTLMELVQVVQVALVQSSQYFLSKNFKKINIFQPSYNGERNVFSVPIKARASASLSATVFPECQ